MAAHYRVLPPFSKATGLDPCQDLGHELDDPPDCPILAIPTQANSVSWPR